MQTGLLTAVAMMAFSANSLLCRMALRETNLDAATFTAIRIASGALVLFPLVRMRGRSGVDKGDWTSAIALFAYAAAFSLAYRTLPAGAGALLLFGAVQITMIGHAFWRGERFDRLQFAGVALACVGLVGMMSPGLSAPPLRGALLMAAAGIAWGIYSLRGRAAILALDSTAGNFLRALPLVVALALAMSRRVAWDGAGIAYAAASGAAASGLGYAIWYAALPGLGAASATSVQLSVPVIAALGGVVFLGEPITFRLIVASGAILGGIALTIGSRASRRQSANVRGLP